MRLALHAPALPAVQVLRALAALMVACWHAQGDAAALAQKAGAAFEKSTALPWMAGVDIFFVVSGFIMIHASAGLFGEEGAARTFLLRRLIRIVPLYWAATGLFLAVALVMPAALNTGLPSLGDVLSSLLFWPRANAQGAVQPVYSLGWTLNYEMLFYGLFAAALLACRTAAGVAASVSAALIGLVLWQRLSPLPLPFGYWGQPIVLEFLAGMALALARLHGVRLPGWARWLCTAAGVALLCRFSLLDQGSPAGVAAFGAAAALLVAAAALGRGETAPSALVRALARLGDASYALYLLHPFVMRALREVFARAGWFSPGWFIACVLLAACLAAVLAYRLFERPATKGLRRLLSV